MTVYFATVHTTRAALEAANLSTPPVSFSVHPDGEIDFQTRGGFHKAYKAQHEFLLSIPGVLPPMADAVGQYTLKLA